MIGHSVCSKELTNWISGLKDYVMTHFRKKQKKKHLNLNYLLHFGHPSITKEEKLEI